MTRYRAYTLIGMLIFVVIGGTIFFHFVEGWSWLDSYFFTVVTLSTVGYGELVPATALGKIGTTVFIFTGLGIFAVAIQQFGHFAIRKRETHAEHLMASQKETHAGGQSQIGTVQNDRKPSSSS